MGSANTAYSPEQQAIIELARAHGLRVVPSDQQDSLPWQVSPDLKDMRLQTARAWLRSSEIRRGVLSDQLGADPAWDMLLDLYINHQIDRSVSVTSACIASVVPATTASRWIQLLVDRGWVVRMGDGSYLGLTEGGIRSIESALDAVVDSDWRYGLQRMSIVQDVNGVL